MYPVTTSLGARVTDALQTANMATRYDRSNHRQFGPGIEHGSNFGIVTNARVIAQRQLHLYDMRCVTSGTLCTMFQPRPGVVGRPHTGDTQRDGL